MLDDLKLFVISIDRKMIRDSWLHRLMGMQPQWATTGGMKEFNLKGHLYRSKIRLEDGLKVLHPQYFVGWKVTDLCIGNSHGLVTWPGVTDLTKVDFSSGDLRVGPQEVECSIPGL